MSPVFGLDDGGRAVRQDECRRRRVVRNHRQDQRLAGDHDAGGVGDAQLHRDGLAAVRRRRHPEDEALVDDEARDGHRLGGGLGRTGGEQLDQSEAFKVLGMGRHGHVVTGSQVRCLAVRQDDGAERVGVLEQVPALHRSRRPSHHIGAGDRVGQLAGRRVERNDEGDGLGALGHLDRRVGEGAHRVFGGQGPPLADLGQAEGIGHGPFEAQGAAEAHVAAVGQSREDRRRDIRAQGDPGFGVVADVGPIVDRGGAVRPHLQLVVGDHAHGAGRGDRAEAAAAVVGRDLAEGDLRFQLTEHGGVGIDEEAHVGALGRRRIGDPSLA